MGCFPVDFQEVKRPLGTKSVKRPITVGKRPINEGRRPIKAMVLVGISVGGLMGCFRALPSWQKTVPLKRPIKRSMKLSAYSAHFLTSGAAKRVVSKRVVLADVPPERKPERGYIRIFPRNENRKEGTFACSPGTETGTRVRSPKPPFCETAFCLPGDYRFFSGFFWVLLFYLLVFFFRGFTVFFFPGALKPGKNLVQFSPTPSMADPVWRSPNCHCTQHTEKA